MTSREKRFVLAGLFLGLAVAGLVYALGSLRGARRSPAGSHNVKATESQAAPAPKPPTAGGAQETTALPMSMGEQVPTGQPLSAQLSEEEQQAIGLQTAEVRRRNIARPVLAVGKVEPAETRLSTISARVGGRIDRLLLDFTGQPVARGQGVALVYSPELVTGAEEYKLARENRAQLGSRVIPEAVAQADELVAAARRKLELWGVASKQIQEIESSPQPKIHITIYSSTSGVVTERKVTEGQYVEEGDVLYTVADLSKVWVMAEIYEFDLPLVRVGQAVEITSEALPGTKLQGRVSFIEPLLNQQTRTVGVRIEVPNPRLRLRPGMFANARIITPIEKKALAVPRSAVLDTGMRKIVYVARGNGLFEGRQVELGPAGEEYYPILSGLREGERVVTHGNFMIDSQTRITGGMTGLFGGSKEFTREGQPSPPSPPAQPAHYKMTFRPEPDPPKGAAPNTFHVSVLDAKGQPVTDAQVKVTLVMPAMPAMGMPEMRASAELSWKGSEYSGTTNVPMAGPWNVAVEVSRGGQLLATYRTRFDAR